MTEDAKTGSKNATKKAVSARYVAFLALKQVLDQGGFAHIVVPAVLKRHKLANADKNLVVELSYGVLRRLLTLDWYISYFSGRPLSKLQPDLLHLLRLGVYQILFLKIPDYASVNETVNLAKKLVNPGAASLANAVLRKVSNQKNELPEPDKKDKIQYLAIKYAHPAWLVDLWLKELGFAETQALLEADNQRPQLTVRINTLKTTKQKVVAWLGKNNIPFHAGKFFSEALILTNGLPEKLINEGLIYVQDEASLAVAYVLNPLPGETVIDLCSGPGGKTTHLAQLMHNRGLIYAVDISESRLNLVKENCQRLGVSIVKYVLGDASTPLKLPQADKVLVDAPCSGLGVLARRPDLRWRKSLQDINNLAQLQLKIIKQATYYLKKTGSLVYSVCTISKKETVEVVQQFLKQHPEFTLVKAKFDHVSLNTHPWLQFFPHKHRTDGFFIAKFKRR